MKMHMLVEAGAKAVNEGDSSDMQGCFVYMRRTSAVPLQALGNHPQKDAQHHIEHGPVALHEVAQPLGHRQYPLAHRQTGENMIGQMHRRLHHAPRVARGAHASTFAGKGHEVVVRAVSAAGADKAVGKDAAFEVFAKRLAHIGLGGAQGVLPIELACTGQRKPEVGDAALKLGQGTFVLGFVAQCHTMFDT